MADRFETYTERALRVLTLAQEEAQRFKHNYIGTEHLLLGLVREDGGMAAKVLNTLGVELTKVRSAVEFIIGRGDFPISEIGLTPRAKTVIELVEQEAKRLNHSYVGTEHLLLGLVLEGEGIAFGVLKSLGVSLERARAETVRVLANTAPEAARSTFEERKETLVLSEDLDGHDLTIAIAVSRFNSLVTERLLAGALEGLAELGVAEERTTVVWVPGSFELPFAARRLVETGADAVICLGCVIKGETDHDLYIKQQVARGIAEVGEATGVPAVFGVLTTDNLEQALARAEEGTTNKGYEAAQAAVVMANLTRRLKAE
jgi:6,7-dimethyl-8-ribityllumazine synthase